MDLTKLYKKQISMTEWLEEIDHADAAAMRREDNEKRYRMAQIGGIIPFPFDEPAKFRATDLANKTPEFMKYLEEHGDEHCALRLIPDDPSLPKLRMRGHTVREVFEGWFQEQDIDPEQYRANFVQHAVSPTWSTIFVVNHKGIFGEIIRGGGHQLTQGFHNAEPPITFSYDFASWKLSKPNPEALSHLESILPYLIVENDDVKKQLAEELDISFVGNIMTGYYETIDSDDQGFIFTDYNRIFGRLFAEYEVHIGEQISKDALLTGQTASPGKAVGTVRIVTPEMLSTTTLSKDDILVCAMTSPAYLPLMKQAAAIVTDQGGLLTHAAIVSRELNIPCLVGTSTATTTLQDGEKITVDATGGTVHKT